MVVVKCTSYGIAKGIHLTSLSKSLQSWVALGVALSLWACTPAQDSSRNDSATGAPAPSSNPDGGSADADSSDAGWDVTTDPVPPLPTHIVALGDLHGDVAAARAALSLAGAIDAQDHWIGGELVVVQVGDQLDRGDQERDLLAMLERLKQEASAVGGALVVLNGNHETMNVEFDFRYVTDQGWLDFADIEWDPNDPLYQDFEETERGRVAAFRPGGPFALLLAEQDVVTVIDQTVFVHGSLLLWHAEYGVDNINQEVRDWMLGLSAKPTALVGSEGPVWDRTYSDEPNEEACQELTATLDLLSAERMVIAHTVFLDGISSACDERVWRVDVGMAAYYGGSVAALDINDGQVTILSP